MADEWANPPKNLLFLPGKFRPETVIYRHLFNMKEADPFWKGINSTYSRQVAITRENGQNLNTGDDKKWVKKWYKKQSKYWGGGNSKVFKSWVKENGSECNKFLKGRYQGDILKSIIEKIEEELTIR